MYICSFCCILWQVLDRHGELTLLAGTLISRAELLFSSLETDTDKQYIYIYICIYIDGMVPIHIYIYLSLYIYVSIYPFCELKRSSRFIA